MRIGRYLVGTLGWAAVALLWAGSSARADTQDADELNKGHRFECGCAIKSAPDRRYFVCADTAGVAAGKANIKCEKLHPGGSHNQCTCLPKNCDRKAGVCNE